MVITEDQMEYEDADFYACEDCLEEDCTDCGEFENDLPEMEYDEFETEPVE